MLFFCFYAISAQGQFKMNSNGKMLLGPPRALQDLGNVLAGSVFGPYGDYQSGSKLAFGDFGRYDFYGWNVCIGEYGVTDTDQLWLHGKNGYYITNGGKPNIPLMYNPSLRSNAVYFTTNIFTSGFFTTSDLRFKSNITPIETPLSKLMSLRGVEYDFNDKERKDALAARMGEIISDPSEESPTEKELQAMADMQEWEELQLQKEHKLGFIAQEVQEIFPDLVKEDDLGYLAVDYNGFIPVVIEAIKEQQRMIDQQNRQIEELEMRFAELKKGALQMSSIPTTIEENDENTTKALLYQNVPNPFNQQTEIHFFLPEQIRAATIYIYDMQGKQIKNISISQRGNSKVIISASELTAGIYLYSLIVDQKEVGPMKMILTK